MDTEQSNKLIAEFMGVDSSENWYNGRELQEAGLPFAYGSMGNGTRDLRFHTSWSWLMPVVEKIEQLEIINRAGRFNITSENFDENYTATVLDEGNNFIQVEGEDKRIATYNAVVEFIKWYNKQHSSTKPQ